MTGIRPVAIDEDENGGINVYGNTASSSSDKIYAAWVKGTWDAPIPRFGAEVTSALPFHINLCSTNLLFPYPTPAATTCVGIAIANGSGKPYSALWNPGDNTVKDISAYFPPDSSDGKVMAVNETGRAVLRSYDKQFKPQFGLIDLGTANPASRVFNLPDPCNSINTHFVGYRRDILAMTCYYPGADNTLQSHAVYINTDTSALSELDPVKFPVSSTAVGGTVLTDPGNIWYPGFTQTGVQTPGSASLSVFPEDGSGLTPLQASIGGEADLGSFLPAQYITSQATSIDSQGDVGGAACTGVFGPCDPVVWTPNKIQAGDVNADASVDVSDVVLVLQSVVGLTTLTLDQVRAADAVGDNVVDVNDAVKILRVVVGLDPGF